MSSAIEVQGIDAALKAIDKQIADFEKNADQIFMKAGKLWEKEAKARARVRTGRMKASVQYVHDHLGGLGIVPVPWSVWIEFGTRRARAFPFALPAYEIAKRFLWDELRKL